MKQEDIDHITGQLNEMSEYFEKRTRESWNRKPNPHWTDKEIKDNERYEIQDYIRWQVFGLTKDVFKSLRAD